MKGLSYSSAHEYLSKTIDFSQVSINEDDVHDFAKVILGIDKGNKFPHQHSSSPTDFYITSASKKLVNPTRLKTCKHKIDHNFLADKETLLDIIKSEVKKSQHDSITSVLDECRDKCSDTEIVDKVILSSLYFDSGKLNPDLFKKLFRDTDITEDLQKIIVILKKHFLIETTSEKLIYRMIEEDREPLLKYFVDRKYGELKQDIIPKISLLLNKKFPDIDEHTFFKKEHLEDAHRYSRHLINFLGHDDIKVFTDGQKGSIATSTMLIVELFEKIADYNYHLVHNYGLAQKNYKKVIGMKRANDSFTNNELGLTLIKQALACKNLAMREDKDANLKKALKLNLNALKLFKDSPIKLAEIHDNIGVVYRHMGKSKESIESHTKAEKLLNTCDSSKIVVKSLDSTIKGNLGNMMLLDNKYDQAHKYYQEAKKIREALVKVSDDEIYKKDLAASHSDFGSLSYKQGKFHNAYSEFQEAQTLHEELYGSDIQSDFRLRLYIKNKAFCLVKLSQYREALKLLEDLQSSLAGSKNMSLELKILEVNILTENNSYVENAFKEMSCDSGLWGCTIDALKGRYYNKKNDFKEAIEFLKTAATSAVKLGKQGLPLLAEINDNLSISYKKLGHYEEAMDASKKAISYLEELLGEKYIEHHDYTVCLDNQGSILFEMGKYDQAYKVFCQSHSVKENFASEFFGGFNHENMATSYTNLGAVSYCKHDYMNVKTLNEKALQIFTEIYGDSHSYVARCHSNIGTALLKLSNFNEAIKHHKLALVIKQKIFGPDIENISIALSYSKIGAIQVKLGSSKDLVLEGIKNVESSLRIKQKFSTDQSHRSIIEDHKMLSDGYCCLGKYDEAIDELKLAKKLCQDDSALGNIQKKIDTVKFKQAQVTLLNVQQHDDVDPIELADVDPIELAGGENQYGEGT